MWISGGRHEWAGHEKTEKRSAHDHKFLGAHALLRVVSSCAYAGASHHAMHLHISYIRISDDASMCINTAADCCKKSS